MMGGSDRCSDTLPLMENASTSYEPDPTGCTQTRGTFFFIDAVAVRGSGYVSLGQLPLPFVRQGMDKFVSGVRLGMLGWWDGWTICWEIDAWAGPRGYCGNGNLGIDHKGGVKTFFPSIV